MNILKSLLILTLVILTTSCLQKKESPPIEIIPEPLSVVTNDDPPFIIDEASKISVNDSSMLPAAHLLQDILKMDLPIVWNAKEMKPAFIFHLDTNLDSLTSEGYSLRIN